MDGEPDRVCKVRRKGYERAECVRSELPAIVKPNYVSVAFVVMGITLAADIAQIFCWAFSANYDSNAIRI